MAYKNLVKRKRYYKKYNKKWYLLNKDKIAIKVRNRRTKIKKFIKEIKSKYKCMDCSERDIRCLDFHHLNPQFKKFMIATACNHGYSNENILKEINKCIVLCANCHRRRIVKII